MEFSCFVDAGFCSRSKNRFDLCTILGKKFADGIIALEWTINLYFLIYCCRFMQLYHFSSSITNCYRIICFIASVYGKVKTKNDKEITPEAITQIKQKKQTFNLFDYLRRLKRVSTLRRFSI